MEATRFEFNSNIPADVESVWRFHLQPEALKHLSPKWMGLRIVDPGNGVADDSLVRAEVGLWPFCITWEALHCNVRTNETFTDIALKSPFRFWVHQHVIECISASESRLSDVIWFLHPKWIPALIGRPLIKAGLNVLFKWRHYKTRKAVCRSVDVGSRCPVRSLA